MTEIADVRDLDNIYQLLYSTSDPMSDHLVSKEELHTFLESSQVLKVVINEKLAGALVFESFGKNHILDQFSLLGAIGLCKYRKF